VAQPDEVTFTDILLRTYRYIRLGLVALVVLLAMAVAIETLRHKQQDSISDYYYTPAHSVFVAALCGTGACMIIYRGLTDLEDVILNGAGYLAFIVAFVPTGRGLTTCDPSSAFCDVPGSTIVDNVSAVVIVGLLGLIVGYLTSIRPQVAGRFAQPVDTHGRLAFWALVVGFAAFVLWFLAGQKLFLAKAHYVAAVLLFLAMLVVVYLNWIHLSRTNARGGNLAKWYLGSLTTMLVATLVLGIAAWRQWIPHGVFWVESELIVAFAGYWLTQTIGQCWNDPQALLRRQP
jgi:hypothetical protein